MSFICSWGNPVYDDGRALQMKVFAIRGEKIRDWETFPAQLGDLRKVKSIKLWGNIWSSFDLIWQLG